MERGEHRVAREAENQTAKFGYGPLPVKFVAKQNGWRNATSTAAGLGVTKSEGAKVYGN